MIEPGLPTRRDQIGGQVGERGKHERSLPQARMGYLEVGFVDRDAVDPDHIDVERAGSPKHGPLAPRRAAKMAVASPAAPAPTIAIIALG